MNQDSVLTLSLILMGGITLIFLWVLLSSRHLASDYSQIQAKAYGFRAKFFFGLVILGVVVAGTSLSVLPYADTKNPGQAADLKVNVIAHQWYWELDKTEAKVGDTVVFSVTSADVNHGVGIYDSDLRLIAQTQAMPHYSNELRMTFDKAGEYQLLCMEYCGLAHHAMVSTFNVR